MEGIGQEDVNMGEGHNRTAELSEEEQRVLAQKEKKKRNAEAARRYRQNMKKKYGKKWLARESERVKKYGSGNKRKKLDLTADDEGKSTENELNETTRDDNTGTVNVVLELAGHALVESLAKRKVAANERGETSSDQEREEPDSTAQHGPRKTRKNTASSHSSNLKDLDASGPNETGISAGETLIESSTSTLERSNQNHTKTIGTKKNTGNSMEKKTKGKCKVNSPQGKPAPKKRAVAVDDVREESPEVATQNCPKDTPEKTKAKPRNKLQSPPTKKRKATVDPHADDPLSEDIVYQDQRKAENKQTAKKNKAQRTPTKKGGKKSPDMCQDAEVQDNSVTLDASISNNKTATIHQSETSSGHGKNEKTKTSSKGATQRKTPTKRKGKAAQGPQDEPAETDESLNSEDNTSKAAKTTLKKPIPKKQPVRKQQKKKIGKEPTLQEAEGSLALDETISKGKKGKKKTNSVVYSDDDEDSLQLHCSKSRNVTTPCEPTLNCTRSRTNKTMGNSQTTGGTHSTQDESQTDASLINSMESCDDTHDSITGTIENPVTPTQQDRPTKMQEHDVKDRNKEECSTPDHIEVASLLSPIASEERNHVFRTPAAVTRGSNHPVTSSPVEEVGSFSTMSSDYEGNSTILTDESDIVLTEREKREIEGCNRQSNHTLFDSSTSDLEESHKSNPWKDKTIPKAIKECMANREKKTDLMLGGDDNKTLDKPIPSSLPKSVQKRTPTIWARQDGSGRKTLRKLPMENKGVQGTPTSRRAKKI